MPELNFRIKISGGLDLTTDIKIIPQSSNEDKKIKLQNGKTISESEIAKMVKDYLQSELIPPLGALRGDIMNKKRILEKTDEIRSLLLNIWDDAGISKKSKGKLASITDILLQIDGLNC